MRVVEAVEITLDTNRFSPQSCFARTGRFGWATHLRYLLNKLTWMVDILRSSVLKRSVEILIAGAALFVLIPLFLVIAILIKVTDGGPVLFWQKRVGEFGREFDFPKFRSMVPNAEKLQSSLSAQNQHGNTVTFKMKRDPRVTWIGRICRKFSLDELPQLWCVMKGDLALVGPRPALPREVARYTATERRRLEVKPGLTCLWQVSGRSELSFDKQVALDLEYIHTQSFRLDLELMLRTIPAVITGRGAY